MFLACWSVKGGSGTSVVAAALALSSVDRGDEVLLVDLDGDQPLVLAMAHTGEVGLAAWLEAASDTPADSLGRLEVDVRPGLRLLPSGRGRVEGSSRVDLLVQLLAEDPRRVVVDCGTLAADRGLSGAGPVSGFVAPSIAGAAAQSLLVLRPCYMAVRRALEAPIRPSGVVVLREPGRALDAVDVEDVVGVPVVAEAPVDPAVARAVDAGLLASRVPRSLERGLRGVT